MAAPINTCWNVTPRPAMLSGSMAGAAGITGTSTSVSASARTSRTRAGTMRVPMTGTAPSNAPMRNSGHR